MRNAEKLIPKATKEGYFFAGWYVDDETFKIPFDSNYEKANPNKTETMLYAKWIEEKSSEFFDFAYTDSTNTAYSIKKKANITLPNEIVLPSSYNGKPVTSIGGFAFSNCSELTSITMPASVTSIEYSAFYNCIELISITIPASVISIDGCAFLGTAWLNNQPNGVVYIGKFAYCYKGTMLTNSAITLRDDTKGITDGAFEDCSGLTSITIPDSMTSIGEMAFENCSGLTSITIPNSVTSIGQYAFRGCSGLTSMALPFVGQTPDRGTSNTDFGYIFGGSSNIPTSLKKVVITGGTSIGDYAFKNCIELTSITIYDKVTSIGDSVFSGCSSLTSMTMPFVGNRVGGTSSTDFGYLFGGSSNIPTSLKKVVITGGTSIGDYAFEGCSGPTSIMVEKGNTTYAINLDILTNKAKTEITLVPKSIKGDIVLPNTLTSIGDRAFAGCDGLTSITIPDSVTSIGISAFDGCSGLTSMALPFVGNTLGGTSNTHFGYIFGASSYSDNASYVPASLKTVEITGVTSIKQGAFEGCNNLTSITLPFVGNTIDSTTNTHFGYIFGASDYSFNASKVPASLKTVVITGGTSIGSSAFYSCYGLISITIPNSVTSIGEDAFRGCSGLTSMALPFVGNTLGGTTNTHFEYLFGGSNHVPASLKTIVITGGTSIGGYAFRGCSGLTSIIIPNSVTSIGNMAFCNCSGLTSITIPNSVTSIESGAFWNCSGLTSIAIGSGVTSIGNEAFQFCSKLIRVTVDEANTTYASNQGILMNKAKTEITLVPKSIKGDIVLPNTLTSIDGQAFAGCSGLTSIDIPNNVTGIGVWAFCDCRGLTSITIPSGVTSIGYQAFSNCSGLTSITIPDSVTSIGGCAFSGCSGLTSITIQNSVTSIGGVAFSSRSSLTSITADAGNTKYHSTSNCLIETSTKTLLSGCKSSVIPTDGSVTSIGDGAFDGCGLTSITIPASVTSIGDKVFSGCNGLALITVDTGNTKYHSTGNCIIETATSTLIAGCKSSVIPTDGSVTSIGNMAFCNCSGLTSITIPNSVTSIESSAFWNCSGLTSITIPSGVTSIGSGAFAYCRGLTKVTVDEANTTYASNQGILMNKAKTDIILVPDEIKGDIVLPNTLTSIGISAFDGCRGLTGVTIPASVTSMGKYAFRGCSSLTSIKCEATSWPSSWDSWWRNGCDATVVWGYTGATTPPQKTRNKSSKKRKTDNSK